MVRWIANAIICRIPLVPVDNKFPLGKRDQRKGIKI